jgi:CDP-diacylglycerol--serine O-phosphatidyltransferase
MLKKNIPNFFTSLNFFCGCIASYLAYNSYFEAAFLFVFLGTFFDLFDGFFARLFNVESDFGVQFDSMADLITSGIVPGVVMYNLFLLIGVKEFSFNINIFNNDFVFSLAPIALVSFLIPLSSAIRLSRFNIDNTQKNEFHGLPAPANALFIVSLPILFDHHIFTSIKPLVFSLPGLLFIIILSSIIMNIRLRLFSFKLRSIKLAENRFQLFFIIISLILFYVLNWVSIPILILIYLLLNIMRNYFR